MSKRPHEEQPDKTEGTKKRHSGAFMGHPNYTQAMHLSSQPELTCLQELVLQHDDHKVDFHADLASFTPQLRCFRSDERTRGLLLFVCFFLSVGLVYVSCLCVLSMCASVWLFFVFFVFLTWW